MPMSVPTVDQSSMGVQPLAAPGVTPVRNDAPQQMQQMGQAVQQAGELDLKTGQTIGDRLNDQVDEAKVKAAEGAALGQANSINYDPQTGFLNQKGQNAIDQYQPAVQAVGKAFQDQLDGLDNPIQKQMFTQLRQSHLLSIGQQMAQHNYQQTSQYAGEAAVGRANTASAAAANAFASYGQTDADGNTAAGDYAKNLGIAEQETLKAVGVMKGAPADSPVAQEALLSLHTQIGTGVVSQMLDARASYAKVQSVYDDLKAKGFLDVRAQDTLGRMVKGYVDQESTRAAVNQSLSDAVRASQGQPTNATGTPDYQFPIQGATITAQPYDPEHGAVTVNTPQASSIQAPADGKVIQVGTDDNGTFGMQIQHTDGSVTTFSGLAASNVKAGDQVQRGENVATSGAPAVLWSLADKNGNATDPTKAGLAPVDLTKVTDETVLGAALDDMRKQVTDPYLQQQATSEMESIVRHNQQMSNAAATQTYKQASDAFYQGGMNWRNIPPTTFNQLTGEQQQQFKDKQTEEVLKNYNQGQAFKEMGETDLVSYFTQHPDMVTPANIDAARPKLANSTYLSLMGKAQDYATNPQTVIQAQDVNERVKFYAEQAGVNTSPKTPADKMTYDTLMHSVQTGVDQIKEQNKGKATPEQVEGLIKQQLIQHTIATPRSPWNPLALFSPNSTQQKYGFQMPAGATHVAPGSDGKMHYTDGTLDLGVVQ
jgi:murein DD-endopeptidase MepM/ murein hydrolase activator NlpD